MAAESRPASGVTLEPITRNQRPLLEEMLHDYLAELSPMTGDQPDSDGRYTYFYLPRYWIEGGRHPYFIRAAGELAGLALVRTLKMRPDPVYQLAEFYVQPPYRRQGVGRAAACSLFDQWPGRWHVGQMEENTAAQTFWRRVIADYTGGNYTESWDPASEGPGQSFSTPQGEQ